jgi:hypothetical protein
MNTKYELGNVIKSSSDFSGYKFPNELPTEEWAGNEARSYGNYLRPVSNLFDNDRENLALVKDLYAGWRFAKNGVVYGCEVVATKVGEDTFYEVKRGAFVNNGNLYYIYPACGTLAKQIETEYNLAGNPEDLKVNISYDYNAGKYSYSYTKNSAASKVKTATSAVALVSGLFTDLEITTFNIEDQVIIPIFKNPGDSTIYFNGTTVLAGVSQGEGNTEFATIASGKITPATIVSTINGDRIEDGTIQNSKIIKNKITLGTTEVSLGSTFGDFTGINTINSVSMKKDEKGQITFTTGDTSLTVPNTKEFILDTACTKAYDEDTDLTNASNVPTSGAVKGYITKFANAEKGSFTGEMTFGVGLHSDSKITSDGQINVTKTDDASLNNGELSGSASIYTAGGIEAAGSIYSKGNVLGLNSGTYSKRELKENITDFTEDAVELINTIKVVNYNYKADADKNHKIGFIADDTHEYFSTVNHNIMDQSNCIGILLAAVQQLSAENKLLKEKLDGIVESKSRKSKKAAE